MRVCMMRMCACRGGEKKKRKRNGTSLTGNERSRSIPRPNLDAASTMTGESIFWTRWPASVFGYVKFSLSLFFFPVRSLARSLAIFFPLPLSLSLSRSFSDQNNFSETFTRAFAHTRDSKARRRIISRLSREIASGKTSVGTLAISLALSLSPSQSLDLSLSLSLSRSRSLVRSLAIAETLTRRSSLGFSSSLLLSLRRGLHKRRYYKRAPCVSFRALSISLSRSLALFLSLTSAHSVLLKVAAPCEGGKTCARKLDGKTFTRTVAIAGDSETDSSGSAEAT